MTMCDFEATVSLSLLGFGLASTIVLSIAVGTDNWLYTSEPYDISAMGEIPAPGGGTGDAGGGTEGGGVGTGVVVSSVTVIIMNSGLWRMCFVYDQGGHHSVSLLLMTGPISTPTSGIVPANIGILPLCN